MEKTHKASEWPGTYYAGQAGGISPDTVIYATSARDLVSKYRFRTFSRERFKNNQEFMAFLAPRMGVRHDTEENFVADMTRAGAWRAVSKEEVESSDYVKQARRGGSAGVRRSGGI